MFEVVKSFGVLQFIEALGFCRFIFCNYGFDIEAGCVLVADNDWHAQEVADAILETVDSRNILHLSSRTDKPFNYEIGLHLYRKYDKEEQLIDFLLEKSFTPVVIVGGILPEFLAENAYVFRFNLRESDIRGFRGMYKSMKNIVLSNVEHLCYEISNFHSSKQLRQFDVDSSYRRCFEVMALTGKVWQLVIREYNDEDISEQWLKEYCSEAATALSNMDDFCGICDVSDAVRKCVFSYIAQNDVAISEFSINLNCSGETIYFDEDFYYFEDRFLKKICQPLLKTVSFRQIKTELFESEILVCNDIKNRNFTVKKSCFDSQTGREIRLRYLKLIKSALSSDEGMELEEIETYKKKMEEMEDGNYSRICTEYESEDF